jgi:hypothetical protein
MVRRPRAATWLISEPNIINVLSGTSGQVIRKQTRQFPFFSTAFFFPASGAGEKKDSPVSKIVILDTRPLSDRVLVDYLEKRGIPLNIAKATL